MEGQQLTNCILRTLLSIVTALASSQLYAAVPAISGNLDAPRDTTIGIEKAAPQPKAGTPAPAEAAPPAVLAAPIDNPLWGIPLTELKYTRERPLFSPSRRPSAPAVVAVPRPAIAPKTVTRPLEPEHPNLQLVGTVVSDTEGIGVFLDESNRNFIRLRTGEGHRGWTLVTVKTREAVLQKGPQSETLRLPVPAAHMFAPSPNNTRPPQTRGTFR